MKHRTALERPLPLPWLIAWRYLRGRRSQMLSSTALAAFLTTALGVLAMVIAMALMSGYTEDLQRKLIGLQGEVIASPLRAEAFATDTAAIEAARALPEVVRLGRVAYGEGSVSSPALSEGVSVVLRGVDAGNDPTVVEVAQRRPGRDPARLLAAVEGGQRPRLPPGVLLGKELQRRLQVDHGDVLRLVVLELGGRRPRFRYLSVRFVDSFSTGFAEFDSRWAILDRETLERARGDAGLDVIELELEDPGTTAQVAGEVQEILGSDWVVQQWQQLNKQLFAALALQEGLLFLVLGLIVVVSTFNVASTLMILVRERMHDVGVLAALGLPARKLWWIFSFYGLSLGALGTFTGVVLGAGAAWILTEYELIRFDPEVAAIYFIESVPFRVEAVDLAAIVTFALGVTLLACSLPAARAARMRPADALRDE
ncbi:MAG: ABC transporter permease [Thermoanaerobaculia bacterium]